MVNKLFSRLKGRGKELQSGSSYEISEGLHNKVFIGLNWSGIPKKGTFNKMFNLHEPVDLDGAVAAYKGRELDEIISYKNMLSKNGAMRHSGDDQLGDLEGNDGLDNESIVVNLEKLHGAVDSIYVFLRSVKKHDFAAIPYSILRIVEVDTNKKLTRVLAIFNLSMNPDFRGNQAMLMGKFERQTDSSWTFTALGSPLQETGLKEIAHHISEELVDG